MKKIAYKHWFYSFVLYDLLFLCLQFLFILSKSHSFIQGISFPTMVYCELLLTFFAHIFLYLLLAVFQTFLLWGLIQYRRISHIERLSFCRTNIRKDTRHPERSEESPDAREILRFAQHDVDLWQRWHLFVWILTIALLFVSNGYFFPLSSFGHSFLPLPLSVLFILFLGLAFIVSLLTFITLCFFYKKYPRAIYSFTGFLLLLLFGYQLDLTPRKIERNGTQIIFIGIDSLNPKHMSAENTPTLLRFINDSVLFKDTISPLAHTYPAWSSILTGLYPAHHRASYNLIPLSFINPSQSIAWRLQEAGYQTIFATDDRRFNNLGNEFGFQKIIGPPIGAAEILLGSFNDFPLSNLLVNFRLGKWLFPFNYMNRASYVNYYPQSFDAALQKTLAANTTKKPLFFATHFTLTHWPYAWASSSPAEVNDEYSIEEREVLYVKALREVDKQVETLLKTLENEGYLKNSIVLLLSDHGEAFYVKGSRQTLASLYQGKEPSLFADYLKRKTSTALEMSIGHGSDLLSQEQYHSLLAFKIYKNNQLVTSPHSVTTRVALIDIAPTIFHFIGLSFKPTDGISLLGTILNSDSTTEFRLKNHTLPERAFIMESGMLPNQFVSRNKAKELAKEFFRVEKNGLVSLRQEKLAALDALKLYAIIQGPWVLALYPDDQHYIPVLLNLETGQWSDTLHSELAKKSPALRMLHDLKAFYKNTSFNSVYDKEENFN